MVMLNNYKGFETQPISRPTSALLSLLSTPTTQHHQWFTANTTNTRRGTLEDITRIPMGTIQTM